MVVCTTAPSRFIGCDVGKASIAVYDSLNGRTETIPNQSEALSMLADRLDDACLVICEATGGYENILLKAMIKAGRAAHRADARKVKAFIRSYGILGKTDAIDAKALARYGQDRQAGLARICRSPSDAALAYMRERSLSCSATAPLANHPRPAVRRQGSLEGASPGSRPRRSPCVPDPVGIATEGALWGSITAHGFLCEAVMVSDDAGQFNVGHHPCGSFPSLLRRSGTQASSALCWVHAERLVHKLEAFTEGRRRIQRVVRGLIWWFYRDRLAFTRAPRRGAGPS